jgi:hypothetical protein
VQGFGHSLKVKALYGLSGVAMAKLWKNIGRKAMTRMMDRVGGKLISGIADTSADAPSARFAPKRNLYEEMKKAEEQVPSEE